MHASSDGTPTGEKLSVDPRDAWGVALLICGFDDNSPVSVASAN